MFWRFGGYANVSTLNTILEKPDVTLEEVLEESDLIQELKQSNSKLIEFLRDDNVLRRLLELVVAPQAPRPEDDGQGEDSEEETMREKSLSPFRRVKKEKSKRQEEFEDWDKADKARTQKAYTSCEVLSSETWSILESLMENQQLLRVFWGFLKRESPLDSTEAAYFTKINETLLDKKTEEMMHFLQSFEGIIPIMLKHIDCAAIMDLLLKIISMEKSEGGAGVVDVCCYTKRKGYSVVRRLTGNTVVTKSRPHATLTCILGERQRPGDADICRRLYQSYRHHFSQRITKRAVLHRSQQPDQTTCIAAVY